MRSDQAALTTYLVPGLFWLHGLSVGKSAGYLAIATMAGAAARIVFGMTTSRYGRAGLHLALIGLLDRPRLAAAALAAALGAAAHGGQHAAGHDRDGLERHSAR